MTTITTRGDRLHIELTMLEKVAGLLRDLDVPLASVTAATAVDDGIAAARGIRAPGLGIPGVRLIGTWRRRGSKAFVSVRRNRPALLLELRGERFDRVLVECDDPQRYVDQLAAAGAA